MGILVVDPDGKVSERTEGAWTALLSDEDMRTTIDSAIDGTPAQLDFMLNDRVLEVRLEPRPSGGAFVITLDVTESRAEEAARSRSRRQLEEAQRMAHVGSFEWDIEANVVSASEELYRIFGLKPDPSDRGFERFLERLHPDDFEAAEYNLRLALQTKASTENVRRIIRPDGVVRVIRIRGGVISDEDGRPLRLVGSCWDITELSEATENLKHSLSLLRATLDAAADGILVVDRKGRITAFNSRFLAMWQVPRQLAERGDDERVLSYVLDQLQCPEDFLRGVHNLYERPEVESFDTLRFRDGRVFERFSIPQWIGGEIVGRVWSFRDVTQRERLLERAMFLADAARLLGSLDAESALRSVARIAVPYLGDACAVDLIDDGQMQRLTTVRHGKGPEIPDIATRAPGAHPELFHLGGLAAMRAPFVVKAGVLGYMTFVARRGREYCRQDLSLAKDLAGRAALTLENAQLYKNAREAVRNRDELLSIAAHEIRGPITSIHLAVQSLVEQKVPEDAMPRLLGIVERADRKLVRFVEELLDVGRIRSGRFEFTFERVDLAEIVREVVGSWGTDLARSGSSLSVTATGPVVGTWDRLRLEQVVTNLLSNAIKFGAGKPIYIEVRDRDTEAELVVKDSGIGIPPEKKEEVFRPFERAVPVRHYGGLGLGLHIVRTIIDRLQGTISLLSRPGEGSTFMIRLPKERAP